MSVNLPNLPPSTIVPRNWDLFIPYFNRVYEDIGFTMNSKDNIYYPMAITSTAQDVFLLPNFGSFIICVSGVDEGLPTLSAVLSKSSSNLAGSVTNLGSQAGNIAPWAAATLTISSSATNFQIRHSVANQSGNFNIRVIGTQQIG